jgi:hypothetical protein
VNKRTFIRAFWQKDKDLQIIAQQRLAPVKRTIKGSRVAAWPRISSISAVDSSV